MIRSLAVFTGVLALAVVAWAQLNPRELEQPYFDAYCSGAEIYLADPPDCSALVATKQGFPLNYVQSGEDEYGPAETIDNTIVIINLVLIIVSFELAAYILHALLEHLIVHKRK